MRLAAQQQVQSKNQGKRGRLRNSRALGAAKADPGITGLVENVHTGSSLAAARIGFKSFEPRPIGTFLQ